MNILLAASAEDKLGKEFLRVSTIPFRLPWAATGLPALQDTGNSNSRLGLWAKCTGNPQTRAKDRSLEQEEILLLEHTWLLNHEAHFYPLNRQTREQEAEPIIPLDAPRTGVSEPHTHARTQLTGQTEGVHTMAAYKLSQGYQRATMSLMPAHVNSVS